MSDKRWAAVSVPACICKPECYFGSSFAYVWNLVAASIGLALSF